MSFAQDVKKEIVNLELDDNALKAEAYGISKLKANIIVKNRELQFDFHTSSLFMARRLTYLFKKLYGVSTEIMAKDNVRLTYKKIYYVAISERAEFILKDMDLLDEDLSIQDDISKKYDSNKDSILRGMFLARGSINNPNKSNYHLEIVCNTIEESKFALSTLELYGIQAKRVTRRKGIVVYLKKAEQIGDFLKVIGATNMLFYFENERIKRDLNNVVNRIMNCDIANSSRSLDSAKRQLDAIKEIESTLGFAGLSSRLMATIILRTTLPDSTLAELSEASEEITGKYMSKSGISHCLKDIEELAKSIKK